MVIISLIILAIGLSMDSLAIALTSGAILGNHQKQNILKIAGILAIIQALFTVSGWYVGSSFVDYIDQYDHWIAFGILLFLGIKIIVESIQKEEKEESFFNPLDTKIMVGLAIAASIDALAVGLSLSVVNQPILAPALIIGIVTFTLSAFGIIFGCKVGKKFNKKINFAGGLILILIGCSILASHTIWATDENITLLVGF